MEKNKTNQLQQRVEVLQAQAAQTFFSIKKQNRKRLTHVVSWGGPVLGMLTSSTPVFADLKETTKSAGSDIWGYIFIAGIVLGVIMLGIGLGFISTGSRKLTEEGQRRMFWAGAAIAGLFLVGLIVKFVIGVMTNGGGSANPFPGLPF